MISRSTFLFWFGLLGLLITSKAQVHAAFGAGSNSFSSATLITTSNDVSTSTDLTNYSAEGGEPGILGQAAYKSAWWRWVAPANGIVNLQTIDFGSLLLSVPAADPILAAYTGSSLNSLTEIASCDSTRTSFPDQYSPQPRLRFAVTAGQEIRFKADMSPMFGAGYVQVQLRFFVPGSRSYEGSISYGHGAGQQAKVALSITPTGYVTGKLTVPGKTYPFSGAPSFDYIFELGMPTAPVSAPVSLRVDLANASGPLNVALVTPSDVEQALLYPIARFKTGGASVAGRYTVLIDNSRNGYLTGTISSSGIAAFKGVTGDGSVVSFSGPLVFVSPGIYGLPFCVGVQKNLGFLQGALRFTENANGDVVDTLDSAGRYKRPTSTGDLFPSGLQTSVFFSGRKHVVPKAGFRTLGFLDGNNGGGKLVVTGVMGEIGSFNETCVLQKTNRFTFGMSVRKPSLVINPATGLVTGSIEEPAGFKRRLFGIITGGPVPVLKGYVTGVTATANFQVMP